MTENEKTYEWALMGEYEKKVIAVSHINAFANASVHVSESHMMRLLNLGQPKCVFVYDGENLKQCRIHKDSVDVMKLICKNYLLDQNIDGIT